MVLDCLYELDCFDDIAFMTNDCSQGVSFCGHDVIFQDSMTCEEAVRKFGSVFVAIGDNKQRQSVYTAYRDAGAICPTLVHPSATVSSMARVGDGTIVMPQAAVNAFATVGEGCIVNTGAVVEHDCVVKDFCHLSPNSTMGGHSELGVRTWLCMNSCIANGVFAAEDVVLGAESVLLRNANAPGLYIGCPAKLRRR